MREAVLAIPRGAAATRRSFGESVRRSQRHERDKDDEADQGRFHFTIPRVSSSQLRK
jgi:hypothetical protein